MSKKMQDIICIALCFMFLMTAVFVASYASLLFINGGEALTKDDRELIVHTLIGTVLFVAWWFPALAGFYLSDAIEEKWKD